MDNRPTKDELGRPLGHRHSTFWEWYPIARGLKEGDFLGKYCLNEFNMPDYAKRRYEYVDGVRGLLVPVSYGKGSRRTTGPKGGPAKQMYWFRLYAVMLDGKATICRHRHERVDRDETTGEFTFLDYWEPFTGWVHGIDGFTCPEFQLVNGRIPVQ